jgi:hypothetical protein
LGFESAYLRALPSVIFIALGIISQFYLVHRFRISQVLNAALLVCEALLDRHGGGRLAQKPYPGATLSARPPRLVNSLNDGVVRCACRRSFNGYPYSQEF